MKKLQSLFLFFACAVCGIALAQSAQSAANTYPNKPIKIIVPFPAGGTSDVLARLIGQKIGDAMGQMVIVDNKPGASGNLGAEMVARAAPDGYTLFMVGINNVINPSLYKDVGYDVLRDFKPVIRVSSAPLAIVASPQFPGQQISDLIAIAKAKPNALEYGSGGNGSITHLSVELLRSSTGTAMVHVPYKGIAQMMTDIMGNQIPLGSPALANKFIRLVQQASGESVKLVVVSHYHADHFYGLQRNK